VSVQKQTNSVQLDLPIRISGIDLCENHILVWGEGKVVIYQMGVGTINEKPFAIGKQSSRLSIPSKFLFIG
jgi:hypothetical protein